MTKEDYLIRLIDKLVNFFPELRNLQIHIQKNNLEKDIYMEIYDKLNVTVSTVLNNKQKTVLSKWLEFMKMMEKFDENSIKEDELESILNNI